MLDIVPELVYSNSEMYTRGCGGTHRAPCKDGQATLRVHLLGPLPILRYFLVQMDFRGIVRDYLPSSRQAVLDNAETLSLLVQNILLSPAPMYRIAEWAAPYSPAALGISDSQKNAVNDDRVARSLELLAGPSARDVFFRLALHTIKRFEIATGRIHHDTTSVTFHGQYQGSYTEPRITRGHNKDHRPDLKQLVFGLNISADGAVPVSHQVLSGNRSDDLVHKSNLQELRRLLGRDDFIYVADSKLCTRKNLGMIDGYGGKFVTILPRTRAEHKDFLTKIREGATVRWRRLLVLPDKRRKGTDPELYWTTANGPPQTSEGHRIVWCRSSQKRELDAQIREDALERAKAELTDLGKRLNRGRLRHRSNILTKAEAILRQRRCQRLLKVEVRFRVNVEKKRLRRGRPKKDDPVRTTRSRVYYLDISRNQEAIATEAQVDGIFPLVTNLQPRKASKQDVLRIYKYQPYVEKRHSLMKSEFEIAPVYLKKPSRAAGLIHATFLAMVLDALIERRLRMAMQRRNIESLPILPEGRHTKTPTTARLLEVFSNFSLYEYESGGERVQFFPQLSPIQKQLLNLLEIDPSVYS